MARKRARHAKAPPAVRKLARKAGSMPDLQVPPRRGTWQDFEGMVESGDPNSSQRIDEIIYGEKP